MLAHVMFGLPVMQSSVHARETLGECVGEFVATFALLSVILSCIRHNASAIPYAVACIVTAGYWFTSSTSFANPAVTVARALSDTFAGIRPSDVPAFIAAQLAGAASAVWLFGWFSIEASSEQPISGVTEIGE
jgi:glycerol uptake facilitator-like aquaporin